MIKKYKYNLFFSLFLGIIFHGFSQGLIFKKENKTETHNVKKKIVGSDKTACPAHIETKKAEKTNVITNQVFTKAYIRRSIKSVHFDVVKLEDIHLDIPAFKQFKNNMTDFTLDGEHEFHTIISKIAVFLGTNHEGKGVTLKIMGSASQIPTSFDPEKPNFNINKDGSSIIGKTSIENNKKLAKARADELAKKINQVFPSIEIITPTIYEIQIGETKWTKETQAALNKAFLKKDKKAIEEVYAPFQKDQWVKVESKERTSKIVKPESLKMYMVSTGPALKTTVDQKEVSVRSVFLVSKKTYDFIGDNHSFSSVEGRDKFLKDADLEIYKEIKKGTTRWYLLSGEKEKMAFETINDNERIVNLYNVDIIDNMDEEILEAKIRNDLLTSQ
ncbi:MAG: hypothetical protein EAZ53_01960 [Bacteroidetes bacterium]|nr:MAG: hypothetical protein EAZ53_01960 [Bacteroidota bacterium]